MSKILILKIGAPDTGAESFCKAVTYLHGDTAKVVTMQDLINGPMQQDDEFVSVVNNEPLSGQPIENKYIKRALRKISDTTRRDHIVLLEGALCLPERFSLIKHLFSYREILVIESVASGVRLTSSGVQAASKKFSWGYSRIDATQTLMSKIRKFESVTRLSPAHKDLFVDLERKLGLPDLSQAAA